MNQGQPSTTVGNPTPITRHAHYTLALLTIIYTFNYLDRNLFSIVLESIKVDLQLTDTQLGLVGGLAFVMFYSVMGIPIAWLADRYNRRNIITIGLAFWSLMTAATGFAANLWQLALTRFLMGAGEASSTAPANSMLADLFDKNRRPFALSVMGCGSTLGMFFAYLVGGWVNEHFGWRMVFIVGGIPGILVAILFYLSVREPARGVTEDPRTSLKANTVWETVQFLSRSRTYVLLVTGGCLMGVHLYANMVWAPTFMIRVHDLPSGLMGTYMAVARGPAGLVGMLLGGFLVQRLVKFNERWRVWLPALVCILTAPMEVIFLFADNLWLALGGIACATLLTSMHVAPMYALLLGVAKVRMRAIATATFLFFGSIVGQLIGPLCVGYMNDYLQAQYGELAIRYSLLAGPIFAVLGALIILSSARHLEGDVRRALEG